MFDAHLTATKVNLFLLFPVVHYRLLCFTDVAREVVVLAPVVRSLHIHSVDCVIVARGGHIICATSVLYCVCDERGVSVFSNSDYHVEC